MINGKLFLLFLDQNFKRSVSMTMKVSKIEHAKEMLKLMLKFTFQNCLRQMQTKKTDYG